MPPPPVHNPASPRPDKIQYPANPRLARMRFLARLLDNSILLPGGYRIGFDPIIGLIPGLGDFLGSLFSIWIIYDAARLGLRKRHLAHMVINVLIETIAGTVPLVGDIFDAAWKANAKNMQIVELHYQAPAPSRPLSRILFAFASFVLLFYALLFAVMYVAFRLLLSLFS
jgi:hypothetical protein